MADQQVEIGKMETDSIVVKVVDQNGEVVQFRVRNIAQFKKMMNAYCNMKELNPAHIRFIFDSAWVRPSDTPFSLNLKDNDVIEIYHERGGPCTCANATRI